MFGFRQNNNGIGLQDRLLAFAAGLNQTGGAQQYMRGRRNELREEEEQRRMTAIQDRLRAELSPVDGPGGSGTGAAPSLQQQMAALENAQLLSPEAAASFAPLVRQRQLAELSQNAPVNERLALLTNPDEAGKAYASQFRDETLAPGSIRTRGGQTVSAAPTTQRFDDRFGTYDPTTGRTTYSQPRDATFAEQTSRVSAERPQPFTLSPGQEGYQLGAYGGVSPTAISSQQRPLSASDQNAIDKASLAIEGINNATNRAQMIMGQIENGDLNLGPVANSISSLRNRFGRSNENSLRFEDLTNWAKEARDAILRANTGVQTDQDAVRALEVIMTTPNDERVVQQSLARFIEAQNGTRSVYESNIARRSGGQSQGMTPSQGQPGASQEAAKAELRRRGYRVD